MIIVFILFVLGLAFGSFLNALEYRIEQEKSMKGRSFCPKCKHQLSWIDLIPVFSWLWLKGKCRYCRKTISIQYPVIELLTGLGFATVGYASGINSKITSILTQGNFTSKELLVLGISLLCLLFITFCLILIALYDYKTTYILSKYVYFSIIAALIYLTVNYTGQLGQFYTYLKPYLLSAVIPTALFGIIYLISKGKWLGAGDIELALLMGLFLGWPKVLIAFYFACIVGSIFGLWKIYWSKRAKMNSEIPFAPFLIAGTFFAFVFGQQLFDIYVRIILGG